MLVAISGSQGSGKSTTLKALEQLGYETITRKTSRSILSDWGVTLSEVNSTHSLTVQFQQELVKRKQEDEAAAAKSKNIVLTERTYADLFTYALVSLGSDNKYSDFIDDYYSTCKSLQSQYTAVCFLTAGHFEVSHDGVRGSNKHYSKMVDAIMTANVCDMTPSQKVNVIGSVSVDARVKEIQQIIVDIKTCVD